MVSLKGYRGWGPASLLSPITSPEPRVVVGVVWNTAVSVSRDDDERRCDDRDEYEAANGREYPFHFCSNRRNWVDPIGSESASKRPICRIWYRRGSVRA